MSETYAWCARGIGALLCEPHGEPELREALVTPAKVREARTERPERQHLGRARADRASERERLLADRHRLVVAPGHHQHVAEYCQHLRALRGRWLGRRELDGALDRGEGYVATAAVVQIAAETLVQQRGAQGVAITDPLDRLLHELDGARRRARVPGQLGGPGV